jgi:photosystem II stability/assembly factor-like uncharacterized protein
MQTTRRDGRGGHTEGGTMSRSFRPAFLVVLVILVLCAWLVPVAGAAPGHGRAPTSGWFKLPSGVTASLFDVDFATYAKGWAVGANGTILRTSDWGAHWRKQASGTTSNLWSVCAVTGRMAWAAGNDGEIVYTFDGGKKWWQQSSASTQNIASIAFTDADHGWAVGGESNDAVLGTSDGGGLWSTTHTGSSGWYEDVNTPDGSNVWIVGVGGLILRSTNGGTSWATQASGTSAALSAVEWASSTWLYAVGAGGTILRTTNGGTDWDGMVSGTSSNLFDIDTRDGSDVWAVGAGGTIRFTGDGGTMWHGQAVPFAGFIRSVSCVDSFVAYTCGDGGTIMRTASQGEIDITKPVSKCLANVTVVRNHTAALRYKISDYMPGCEAATVTVKIKKLDGTLVKAFRPVIQLSNINRTKTFVCKLPVGTYRYYAYATDLNRNKASKLVFKTLTVK